MSLELDPEPVGWFHHGAKILELVQAHRPKVCVELGTWMGASAIPVARAIQAWGGTLTCIDTWFGMLEHAPVVAKHAPPWMLVSCARNMIDAGVSANIRLIPATTQDAARYWREPIDYLYIDADHRYESVRADLELWTRCVKSGGVILGDDYGAPGFPGVTQAWDEFEEMFGLSFTRYQSDPPDPDGIHLIYGSVP
jgi:predicted O-methyltransferase YrrM